MQNEVMKQASLVHSLLGFTQDLKLPKKVFRKAINNCFNEIGIRGGFITDEYSEEAENLRDWHGFQDRKYE